MDLSTWYIVIIISLLLSAFFSGMEIAFISSNKLHIEVESKQGDWTAKALSRHVKRPSRFIGVMLLGNNIALVVFGIGMANILEPPIVQNISSNDGVVLLTQTVISTLIVLGFAEFLPKTLFRINPIRTLRLFVVPITFIYYLLWVPMIITIGLSEFLLRIFVRGDFEEKERAFGRVDLDHLVRNTTEYAKDKEELDHEVHIFRNAMQFKDVKARDCMVPRPELLAMEVEDSIEELKQEFVESGYSKILIYRDSIDNIIGYVHSAELLKQPESIKSILLPISIFPESKPAKDVLEALTMQKRSIAVVVDEFGGTSGIVTIEDVMEEIFGEIEDEHDSEELIEDKREDGTYVFSARHEIDYLNEKYELGLPVEETYETLAGLILHTTETIPNAGETFEIQGYTVKIVSASHTRIETVKLEPSSEN